MDSNFYIYPISTAKTTRGAALPRRVLAGVARDRITSLLVNPISAAKVTRGAAGDEGYCGQDRSGLFFQDQRDRRRRGGGYASNHHRGGFWIEEGARGSQLEKRVDKGSRARE